MSKKSGKILFLYLKWLIAVVSLLFVAYKLIDFWHVIGNKPVTFDVPVFLLLAVLAMPLNWLVESYKWQRLLAPIAKIKLGTAIKSVLSGVAAGVFTPNRLGEPFGRMAYVSPLFHTRAFILSLSGSFIQSGVTFAFGFFALLKLPSFWATQPIKPNYSAWLLFVFLLIFAFTWLIFSKKIKAKLRKEYNQFVYFAKTYPKNNLPIIVLLSVLRYVIFSVQQYWVLVALGVTGSFTEIFARIFAFYFIISYLPVVPVMGFGLRASVLLMLFGNFTENSPALVLAALIPWVVNIAFPAGIGAWFMAKGRFIVP